MTWASAALPPHLDPSRMEARPFVIDVFADVVCPWCYVGARRLRRALALVRAADPGVVVEARWRPFLLQPDLPKEGRPWADFASEEFGAAEPVDAVFEAVRAAAAEDATFHFDRIATVPNTVDAHRLILWAQQRGRTWALADTLFDAYFARGADLGDRARLAREAGEAGLDAAAARAFLDGGDGYAAVAESQRVAGELGIRGVPYYILGGRYSVRGAQPVDVLARAVAGVVLEQRGPA